MKLQKYRDLLITLALLLVSTASSLYGQSPTFGGQSDGSKLPNPTLARSAGCGDAWDTTFTTNGVNGTVYAVVNDGAGNVYIGGNFTIVNGTPANGVAKWNGTSWSSLGSGVGTFGIVKAIAVSGNDVYIGGDFGGAGGVTSRNVAKWNGTSWSALGTGLGGGTHTVFSIAILGNDVFIGGNFNVADGSPADGLVRWNGSAFSNAGILGQVSALATNAGAIYAGGNIALVQGGPALGLLKWDGTSWSTLGTANNTSVNAIAFSGSDIYAAGSIRVGANSASVGKFDGTAWTLMQTFSGGDFLSSIAFVGTDLYVGGQISNVFNNIARWNGSSWVGVSGGVTGDGSNTPQINGMAALGNSLVVGGSFARGGTAGARNIAKLTGGTTWSGFDGTGIDGAASAIAVSGTDVYVGGAFGTAGPITANKIAKWNSLTNTWSTLGTGISSGTSVNAIAVAGNKVYAGGTFSSAGGVSASNIAVWNGTAWAALGTGVNATVYSIITRGEDVYVGGSFTTAGGVTANRVAKWNGTAWVGLNSAILPTTVVSMSFMGNDLYVGIPTTTVANPAYFSKYDGTTWTPLGADLGDRGVSSVAVVGTDVYVAGGFVTVNGVTVNRIVKWNGTSWSPLGNGLPSPIGQLGGITLAADGPDLIATGDFTLASGGPADRIARWNGTSWSAMGTGLNAAATGLAPAGGDVFVGGPFTTAGCNQSPYFARWRQTSWTGSTNTDWHTASNWGGSSVPPANAGISIGSTDVAITSADVTVSSLIVTGGRTVTIGAGRTLTVNRNLDLSNGSVAGPGMLVINGDVNLNGGTIAGLTSLTVNGSLNLGSGTIAGTGPVNVTSCRLGAISGGSTLSFVNSPLTRCVNSAGTYRFPVGSNGVYAPFDLSSITGSGTFTVEPKTGGYSGAAAGLPANRLNRWWSTTNSGVTQANIDLTYLDAEIVGLEQRYKIFSINGGNAQVLSTTLNTTTNRASVTGISAFSAFTMADGPSLPQELKGRVRAASGKGAFHVLVSLTDEGGNVRYAFANPFGYYHFPNVMTWGTYTITVQAKRYTFASNSQSVLFAENAADVNFTATNH